MYFHQLLLLFLNYREIRIDYDRQTTCCNRLSDNSRFSLVSTWDKIQHSSILNESMANRRTWIVHNNKRRAISMTTNPIEQVTHHSIESYMSMMSYSFIHSLASKYNSPCSSSSYDRLDWWARVVVRYASVCYIYVRTFVTVHHLRLESITLSTLI
jgi:hypothetical protein